MKANPPKGQGGALIRRVMKDESIANLHKSHSISHLIGLCVGFALFPSISLINQEFVPSFSLVLKGFGCYVMHLEGQSGEY
jgi:hypothetical protein